MKKTLLIFGLLIYSISFSQFLPSGTSTTDNKSRIGGIALGYNVFDLPPFNANKLMINGNQFIEGRLEIGTTINVDDSSFNWGLKSKSPFVVVTDEWPLITLRTETTSPVWGMFQAAVATGDYYFNNVANAGDVVLKGHTSGSYIIGNTRAGDIKFTTRTDFYSGSDIVRMIIDKEGKIGIGTETPDAELSVNGLIHTKEVKVDLQGWPDYVFEENYKLPSLDEVEEYIKEEGHLPNIPSAEEVEENGVQLGEMNKKLLEKVEELTLYIIELRKELNDLKLKSEDHEE
ncbi:MAG: hypothetical protein KYX68_13685 [Flavobacterium sp.]|nr:hypothetical protein [Flavobacterium sp.]